MLTFYGSPDKKCRLSYDSKKYTIRSSLPKLNKWVKKDESDVSIDF